MNILMALNFNVKQIACVASSYLAFASSMKKHMVTLLELKLFDKLK